MTPVLIDPMTRMQYEPRYTGLASARMDHSGDFGTNEGGLATLAWAMLGRFGGAGSRPETEGGLATPAWAMLGRFCGAGVGADLVPGDGVVARYGDFRIRLWVDPEFRRRADDTRGPPWQDRHGGRRDRVCRKGERCWS